MIGTNLKQSKMQKNFLRFFILICLSAQLLGCATQAYFIEESNLPVSENRKAITTVIGQPRVVSLNGRELSSVYHDQKFEPLEEGKRHKSRYYTKVVILGPRRPYEVSVEVIKERIDPKTQTYVEIGLDEGLTYKKAVEIKRALNKSLESSQVIDGGAPF